ncbi:MAG: anaerobic ribonucleoside-triphosphate reductase activating protein [Ruminococcaceae bacterium]|nr:anaerobic ribonucleoside-triphosphate reductase activating protein [Oscillospiraceae bacterium]
MELRLYGEVNDSIVDGPGIRYGVFVQGCFHHCEGCHNPDSHDPAGGYLSDTRTVIEKISKNPLLDGVTFSGGEPFLQAKPLTEIAHWAREQELGTMAYTGFLFEDLLSGANEENGWREFLAELDLLVDGKFVLALRSIELDFCGSSNQRLIDVQKSLAENRVVLWEL